MLFFDEFSFRGGARRYGLPDILVDQRASELASRLLRKRLPFRDADLAQLLDSVLRLPHHLPAAGLLRSGMLFVFRELRSGVPARSGDLRRARVRDLRRARG